MLSLAPILLAVASLTGAAEADDSAAPTAPSQADASSARAGEGDARLARWQSLDPARRAELVRRFEELERMSPDARARLGARAKKLAQEMERALEALPAERRAWVESLPAEKRARVLRGLVAERAQSFAARIRERLTPEERQRLEGATPEEREAILREVKRREYARLPEALERLGRELGVGPLGLGQALDEDPERAQQLVIEYVRQRARRRAERNGPPAGFGAKEWARVLELPDDGFVRVYARARFAEAGRGQKRDRLSQLTRDIEMLTRPSLEVRALSTGVREGELRRRTLLERRAEVETLLAERLELPPDARARIRELDADMFPRAVMRIRRALRRGEDPVRAIRRGATRGGGPATGDGDASRGRESAGRRSGGRSSAGRSSNGRRVGGREAGGRKAGGRDAGGRSGGGGDR